MKFSIMVHKSTEFVDHWPYLVNYAGTTANPIHRGHPSNTDTLSKGDIESTSVMI